VRHRVNQFHENTERNFLPFIMQEIEKFLLIGWLVTFTMPPRPFPEVFSQVEVRGL
jgi:hypothetical protein